MFLWFQVYRFSCFVRAISVTTVEKRTNGKNRWIYTSAWNAVSSHDSLAKSAEENLNTNTISRSITSLSTITSICLCCELRFKIEYRIFDLSNVLGTERILHDNLDAKKMRLTRERFSEEKETSRKWYFNSIRKISYFARFSGCTSVLYLYYANENYAICCWFQN